MNNVICYGSVSTDGWTDDLWCVDGKVHAQSFNDSFEPTFDRIEVLGKCDGSCVESDTDLHQLVNDLNQTSKIQSLDCPSTVEIQAEVQALLDHGGALIGHLIEDGYCKRNSRWKTVCVSELHVTVSIDLGRAPEEDATKHHSVTASRCDGSCREVILLNKRSGRLLRKAMREDIQSRSEQSVR